ncbi:unnamed protein product [Nezara viridula]|uniref:Uncharacterized protein n=1 Tax=Nezara viridula TaxID=85310 RepID=A0A9P0H2V6_NEZVI|nr:unnamed protein product [Nezara viridula]CAH1389078.1 unnamed protein product [Nezara viridula]CAH1389786.1 unnamed protein product [Nezara viridula]CAH1390647.1 unnamed protein product [Nezara viridula]CAH1392045.1 unnamed protein product [Nezara viridula]
MPLPCPHLNIISTNSFSQ